MAKRIYNTPQKIYMMAKANLEVLNDAEKEIDKKYIAENNIINPDGSIPCATYAIEDDAIADKAIDDVGKILADSGLWAKILEARKDLKTAEDNLVEYGLSIAPKKERDILTKSAKTNYTIRQKIIDLVIRLDVSTVR
jgi:hypothetical protein